MASPACAVAPPPRRCAVSPCASQSAAISPPRSGCRGAMTVNQPSPSFLAASITVASSPSCVEAARRTFRDPAAVFSIETRSGFVGLAWPGSLSDPPTRTRWLSAPRAMKRWACVSSTARTSDALPNRPDASACCFCQRENARSESCADRKATGTPDSAVRITRFGQKSDSRNSASRGFTRRRNEATMSGWSSGW